MLGRIVVFLLSVVPLSVASGPNLPSPNKQPAAQSPSHRKLLLEGIQLHDMGDYNAAIARFEKILEENPADVTALYELGNTLMAAKEYKRSLEVAMRGAEFDSPALPHFYATIASVMDELGDQKSAIAVYEHGMRLYPRTAILPFNLAVTYDRMQKSEDARRMYEAALRIDPNHVPSHYRLAALYRQNGYDILRLLASLRFLELAQDTRRSQEVLQFAISRLLGDAQAGEKPNHINITVNLDENNKTDEGDFTSAATMIAIGSALRFTEPGKSLPRPALVLRQAEMLFESFENNKAVRKEKKKFAAAFYAAYLRELHKAHHTEAFTYSVLRQSGWPEVADWLNKNTEKLKAYTDWSRAYPRASEPK